MISQYVMYQFCLLYDGKKEEDELGNHCSIYLGGTPSRDNPNYWNGNIPWINSGEINKKAILEATEYITELGLNKSATKLMKKDTIVLAITGATLGQVSVLKIDCCANQSVVGIEPSNSIPYEYLRPLIKYKINHLVNMQTGGAQQHINKDNVSSLRVYVPSRHEMTLYVAKVKPLLDEEERLLKLNKVLFKAKQKLLQKYF